MFIITIGRIIGQIFFCSQNLYIIIYQVLLVIRQECGQTLGRVRVRTDIGQ